MWEHEHGRKMRQEACGHWNGKGPHACDTPHPCTERKEQRAGCMLWFLQLFVVVSRVSVSQFLVVICPWRDVFAAETWIILQTLSLVSWLLQMVVVLTWVWPVWPSTLSLLLSSVFLQPSSTTVCFFLLHERTMSNLLHYLSFLLQSRKSNFMYPWPFCSRRSHVVSPCSCFVVIFHIFEVVEIIFFFCDTFFGHLCFFAVALHHYVLVFCHFRGCLIHSRLHIFKSWRRKALSAHWLFWLLFCWSC